MKRRDLLKLTALTAGAATLKATPSYAMFGRRAARPQPRAGQARPHGLVLPPRRRLHRHPGQGHAEVLRRLLPQAIKTCATLRAQGQHRYIWTTAAWLLYEYLEQASPAAAQGDRAVHRRRRPQLARPALQLADRDGRSLHDARLPRLLRDTLDSRFGHKTVGAKMSDVPGHTRGIIKPLADARRQAARHRRQRRQHPARSPAASSSGKTPPEPRWS